MVVTESIRIERTKHSRISQVDFANLPFGKIYTDHMFMADYRDGEWKNSRIVPYGHISISPATPAIHYGQAIFEGMKAMKSSTGDVLVFRAADNWMRLNISGERICMPHVPEELFMEGLSTLVALDQNWVPKDEGSSLYIRPFLFSADEYIGIRPSENFTFMIILSPVGPYYSTPVKVKIETQFTRASEGGTGYAKAGGNYGAALYPAKLAQDEGYHQLLWTDGKSHQYIEESGTMNVMLVIDDTLITPALSDSILAGITRDSVLKLARKWGMSVEERKVSVTEVIEAASTGRLREAFGVGTAATIAHIELIGFEGKDYYLPAIAERKFANQVYKELEGIKRGTRPDPFGWITKM